MIVDSSDLKQIRLFIYLFYEGSILSLDPETSTSIKRQVRSIEMPDIMTRIVNAFNEAIFDEPIIASTVVSVVNSTDVAAEQVHKRAMSVENGITARSLLDSETAMKLETLRINVARKLNASLNEYVSRFNQLNREFAGRTQELGREFEDRYEDIAARYAEKVKTGNSSW